MIRAWKVKDEGPMAIIWKKIQYEDLRISFVPPQIRKQFSPPKTLLVLPESFLSHLSLRNSFWSSYYCSRCSLFQGAGFIELLTYNRGRFLWKTLHNLTWKELEKPVAVICRLLSTISWKLQLDATLCGYLMAWALPLMSPMIFNLDPLQTLYLYRVQCPKDYHKLLT